MPDNPKLDSAKGSTLDASPHCPLTAAPPLSATRTSRLLSSPPFAPHPSRLHLHPHPLSHPHPFPLLCYAPHLLLSLPAGWNFAKYEAEVEARIEKRERLALRNKVVSENTQEIYGD